MNHVAQTQRTPYTWGVPTVTQRIRSAVKARGTVREIAREAGVSASMITRFVQGGDLRGRTLDRLAQVLGLELRRVVKGGRR
jgi:transcriptional regulator with XRE-family HTH domain